MAPVFALSVNVGVDPDGIVSEAAAAANLESLFNASITNMADIGNLAVGWPRDGDCKLRFYCPNLLW